MATIEMMEIAGPYPHQPATKVTQSDIDKVSALEERIKRAARRPIRMEPAPTPQSTATEHFSCPICKDLLYESVITQCGHTFCGSCYYANMITTNATLVVNQIGSPVFRTTCPLCRSINEQTTTNHAINSMLLAVMPEEYARRGKEALHDRIRRELLPEVQREIRIKLREEQEAIERERLAQQQQRLRYSQQQQPPPQIYEAYLQPLGIGDMAAAAAAGAIPAAQPAEDHAAEELEDITESDQEGNLFDSIPITRLRRGPQTYPNPADENVQPRLSSSSSFVRRLFINLCYYLDMDRAKHRATWKKFYAGSRISFDNQMYRKITLPAMVFEYVIRRNARALVMFQMYLLGLSSTYIAYRVLVFLSK